MITWVSDTNGNKCSDDYFGSAEAAQEALDSLNRCRTASCPGLHGAAARAARLAANRRRRAAARTGFVSMFARLAPSLLVVAMATQITPVPLARSDQYQIQPIPPGDLTTCWILEGQANEKRDVSPIILLPCIPPEALLRDR